MDIVKRLEKGSALTHAELDNNFYELESVHGWMQYSDGQYTEASPLVVSQGVLYN